MKNTINYPLLILLLFIFFPSSSLAENPPTKYISAGIAFPTPTNYTDFTFGTGVYIDAGWITPKGLFEIYYFDTSRPAKSNRATNIELERISGPGPTDYSSRAITVCWGLSYYFFKAKAGISYRKYTLTRPDDKISDNAFGLSYGFGVNFNLHEKLVLSIDYNSIDHLVATGNIGLTMFF